MTAIDAATRGGSMTETIISALDLPNSLLFVAHPGHELLIHGWLSRAKPRVCVLTDGAGADGKPRIDFTETLLRDAGAAPGRIFGRFTDLESYTWLFDRRVDVIDALVNEVAEEIASYRIELVMADAMEGLHPVHDLSRMIVGAACARTGSIPHYEFPLHEGPHAFHDFVTDLDDAAFARKIEWARKLEPQLADIGEMFSRFGEDAFRRESFRRVTDWTATPWDVHERPLYERIGEEHVARGRFTRVIRYAEHVQPLLDHVRETTCAF
jgi:hypothetical protein